MSVVVSLLFVYDQSCCVEVATGVEKKFHGTAVNKQGEA